MPVSVSVLTLLAEPVAAMPAPTPVPKPVADRLPPLVEMSTVRVAVPVPRAPAANVIWPAVSATVMFKGRLSVGRLTAEALTVLPETLMLLPAAPPTMMPVVLLLRVTLTEPASLPLKLALSLPLPR